MAPIELLVIDEATQLKKCEAAIPLQLCGVRCSILIGDESQLPTMVQSKEATTASMVPETVGRLQLRLIFEESSSTDRRKGQQGHQDGIIAYSRAKH
ncbi:hypothetical protein JHK85_017567 [Glycine max]|nr:hypothetical protein JHK85_017567 [Glycine max]